MARAATDHVRPPSDDAVTRIVAGVPVADIVGQAMYAMSSSRSTASAGTVMPAPWVDPSRNIGQDGSLWSLQVSPPSCETAMTIADASGWWSRSGPKYRGHPDRPSGYAEARDAESEPIELVRGREAVEPWWVQVQHAAREEVLICDRPPYVMPFTGDRPGKLEAVRTCVEADERARVRAGVPIKLLVGDGTRALTHDVADVH